MSEDPKSSVELTPHAEFVVGQMSGMVNANTESIKEIRKDGKIMAKDINDITSLQASQSETLHNLNQSLHSAEATAQSRADDNKELHQTAKKDANERITKVINKIDSKMDASTLKWEEIFKQDQDAREEIINKKIADDEKALAEKKELRNKVLVKVISWLIISALVFTGMIVWLGIKVYLKSELEINKPKQEIRQNATR